MDCVPGTPQCRAGQQNQQGDEEKQQGDGQSDHRDEVYGAAEAHIHEVQTGGVVGPGLVGVRVDPPVPVLHATLLCAPGLVEPEVDKVGTLLCLGDPGGRGVEAGPRVEYEGTVLGVVRVLNCSVYTI